MSKLTDWKDLHLHENKNNVLCDQDAQLLDGHKVHAQHGEEGVLRHIFSQIGTDSKFCVDIGAKDGLLASNTRWLIEQGWQYLLLDKDDSDVSIANNVKEVFVTAENICTILAEYNVPKNVDFLSIDIDYNDYWVLKAVLEEYRFKLICFEFNPNFGPFEAKTVPYAPKAKHDHTIIYGASLAAFKKLGEEYGYPLIHTMKTPPYNEPTNVAGRNGFLIHNSYLPDDFNITIEQFHPEAWQETWKKRKRTGSKAKKYYRKLDRKGVFKPKTIDGFENA